MSPPGPARGTNTQIAFLARYRFMTSLKKKQQRNRKPLLLLLFMYMQTFQQQNNKRHRFKHNPAVKNNDAETKD